MEPDFSGFATKAGLKCSDGRTIMPDAFKHMDGQTVPLVWQHGHNEPANVLGHAVLEYRENGDVYAKAFFNDTPAADNAKALVIHKDITRLSIYANQLVERSKSVYHGVIREVSLVLAGANPGALIDNISIAHGDDISVLEDEAIIYTDLPLEHSDGVNGLSILGAESDDTSSDIDTDSLDTIEKLVAHMDKAAANADGPTIQDVFDTLNDEQKALVHYMLGAALESAGSSAEHSDDTNTDEGDLTHQEGTDDMKNVFENNGGGTGTAVRPSLTHDQLDTIVSDAQKMGSFKESFLAHAVEYGIENIDFLFPDAKTVADSPEFVARRMEWVTTVINGAKKNPFSRIKTLAADITFDEARAKGYVKGSMKKDEWFGLTKRVTTPSTIYKKQKLDRDDIIDITDLDVVAWLKAEMRVMLDEELARAALIGDGREVDDEDKIDQTTIRPIAYDDDFYAHKVAVSAGVVGDALIDEIVKSREFYRGAGNPTMFTTEAELTKLLLVKDTTGRRIYPTVSELAAAARVSNIVTVPVMEGLSVGGNELLFILVNMSDYTFGADKGGAIGMFDDFDIDYNQYKYLMETRASGTLTKFKSALVISRATTSGAATPNDPTFNTTTGVLTIVATTGVVYKNAETGATLATGAQTAIASGASVRVKATPAAGYVLANNAKAAWLFTRN